ncbi:MAG: transcriptional regulator [Chloroflexi bacterium]|nr:transcriptional regulator [Chloroflexota bacterium]
MSGNELTPEDLSAITEIDRLVHQPARLSILTILYVVENASFIYVMRQTGLTRGNLSSHLSKLESAGYVEIRKEFVDKIPRTLLSLTSQGREAFQSYRQRMRQVLERLPE